MNHGKISIRGAKVNNLKNIDVDIPRNKLVVITGLSGSGKSSLAFDTLYADGQRRYVESLSSYARQYMGKITKPNVESIKGIPPAIAIEQRVISRNPRSTVGTTTEIYEYLKLLFARIGRTYSPVSKREVKREDIRDVMQYIQTLPDGAKVYLLAPIITPSGRTLDEQLRILNMQGYSRVIHNKRLIDIEDILSEGKLRKNSKVYLFIDRFKAGKEIDEARITASIQTAFSEGKGEMNIQVEKGEKIDFRTFNNLFEMDGISFEEPTPHLFSFNNPYGACKTCGGTGNIEGIAPHLVIPDPQLSVFENGVACWRGEKMQEFKEAFIQSSAKLNFPIHKPIRELSKTQQELLWKGNARQGVFGINDFFASLEENRGKMLSRILLSRFRGRTLCTTCNGTRVREDANYVKVNGKSISDIVTMPIEELHQFFTHFTYNSDTEREIGEHLVHEIITRLQFLLDVGLGYLTLNRPSKTLSGGEAQRINLATTLGSSLIGSLYILDEPSIGLHPRDTHNLIKVLHRLRDIGNTVVVVEHDEEIIRAADYIIDIGPKAGELGGEIVFCGTFEQLIQESDNLTAQYIRGMTTPGAPNTRVIQLPERRRRWRNYVEVMHANKHNLKDIDVKIPLDVFTVITGVSGSGKSTLIKEVVIPAMKEKLTWQKIDGGNEIKNITLTKSGIDDVILIDQNPIGKSTRSNPATYLKIYDEIRELYAAHPLSKQRNYKPSFFSFNVPGGRCEACEGEGVIHIEMQFMADVTLLCNECKGAHFKDEVLDIKVNGKTISDILEMTIQETYNFFSTLPKSNTCTSILNKIKPLLDVGLGYLKMGQPSTTLSGGEAQRIKLAYFLSLASSNKKYIFFFDEPTTGLHFHDINQLYKSFNHLIEIGHTIVVIEHNPELIKCADWIIDLGPDGGNKGGKIVFAGKPEEILKHKKSQTRIYIQNKLFS